MVKDLTRSFVIRAEQSDFLDDCARRAERSVSFVVRSAITLAMLDPLFLGAITAPGVSGRAVRVIREPQRAETEEAPV